MPRSRVSCPVHGSGGTLLTLENCLSTTVSITLSTIPVEAPDCHSGVGAVCGSCGHISARIRHCPTLFGTPWSRRWLHDTLGLFGHYRVYRRKQLSLKALPA